MKQQKVSLKRIAVLTLSCILLFMLTGCGILDDLQNAEY